MLLSILVKDRLSKVIKIWTGQILGRIYLS